VRAVASFLWIFPVAALTACGEKAPTGTGALVSRVRLNGQYTCVRFEGVFAGPQGPGRYEGTCEAYANVTRPSRRDSVELAPFSIGEDNSISRQEFPGGTLTYDSTTAVLTVTDSEQRVERYRAAVQGGVVFLIQQFPPFDFSGDGVNDELTLVFRRR